MTTRSSLLSSVRGGDISPMAAEKDKADHVVHDNSEPTDEKGDLPHPNVTNYRHDDVAPAITDYDAYEGHETRHSDSEDDHDQDHDHDHEQDEQASDAESGRARSSRASSIFSRSQSVVSRTQRRGILARFAIIPEIERPYDYKRKTKWAITAIIALAAGAAPMGSGIFYRKSKVSGAFTICRSGIY